MSDEVKKGKFGISKDTKASNSAPLLAPTKIEGNPQYPSNWKFPIARLVNVIFNSELEKKDGTTVPVLQFVFRDSEGRQHIHTEWVIEESDAKETEKIEGMNSRIAHIYTVIFGKMPEKGIGQDATSFADFFEKVKLAFDSVTKKEGEETKKVYPMVSLYYKLTYYKGRQNFPLSPNFLERVVQGKPCKTLGVNLRYDDVVGEVASAGGGIPGMGGSPAGDDLPDFSTGAYE